MTKIGMLLGIGVGAVVLVSLPGGAPPDATAARNPAKASVKCRKTIAKTTFKVVVAGLQTIQRCHAQRLKGRASGDCNSPAGITFDRAKSAAIARMNIACKAGDPVLENYEPPTIGGGIPPVFTGIEVALAQSGAALLGAPVFDGDKAKTKCHNSLSKGQTAVVLGVLKAAFRCQQGIDKRAQTFGAIDPSCLVGSGGAGARASSKIARACGTLNGTDVGSCASLPGCLVSAAEATAQLNARLTYGRAIGTGVCGDGVRDAGEECDDGNTIDDATCTADCKHPPVCGDNRVDPGEDCDELGSGPTRNCLGSDLPADKQQFECKLNTCGDGFKDEEEPTIEDCDDGNTTANDGCTNCTVDPIMCNANGVDVTVALTYPEMLLGGISAILLDLSYPPPFAIPGSGTAATVRDRVTNVASAGSSLLPNDKDTNADVVDDLLNVQARASTTGSLDPGPVFRVRYDCPAGTPVAPDTFGCVHSQSTGLDAQPFPPELAAEISCAITVSAP